MGSSVSKLTDTTIRDELLRSTALTRSLMDRILDFLLREVKPRDFSNLSSASECSKYVVFLADMFDKMFVPLRIVPGKDREGVIFFRKVDELRDDTKQPNRRALCLALGYFYTKLFQIIAALSYTIFDETTLRIAGFGQLNGPALLPPGARFRGGAIDTELQGNFKILAPYLSETRTEQLYEFEEKATPRTRIFLKLGTSKDIGTISVFKSGANAMAKLILECDIMINYVKTYKKGLKFSKVYNIVLDEVFFNGKKVSYKEEFGIYGIHYDTNKYQYGAIEYPSKNMRVDRAIEKALINIIGKFEREIGYDDRIERRGLDIDKKDRRYEKERLRRLFGEEVQKRVEKKDTELEGLLSAGRPVAHCVARALQLLDIDALGPRLPPAARSYICMSKFNSQIQKSVPGPGGSFKQNAGLDMLATLFTQFTPGGAVITETAKQEYIAFLQRIAVAEGMQGKIVSGTHAQIIDKRSEQLCKTQPRDTPIIVSGAAVGTLRHGVEALFKKQAAHAVEVNNLLRILFEITPENKLRIHPQILRAGIPALDMVAEKTRHVLMNYYENCESIYQSTLMDVKDRI